MGSFDFVTSATGFNGTVSAPQRLNKKSVILYVTLYTTHSRPTLYLLLVINRFVFSVWP